MLTPATLDADWALFDNVKLANIALFNITTEEYTVSLPPKTCQVLGPFDLTEEDLQGLDESLLHHETCIITVRISTFISHGGAYAAGIKEEDRLVLDGITWTVASFKNLSWQTRYRCVCYKA